MHVARILAITEVKNVPQEIRPFVEFKAPVEDRKLADDEKVAILVIDTTTCYVPVFLKDSIRHDQLERCTRAGRSPSVMLALPLGVIGGVLAS